VEHSWSHAWSKSLNDLQVACDIPSAAHEIGTHVGALYSASDLPYHNLDHIFSGLDLLDRLESEGKGLVMPQVRYCWMNHDSHCDAGNKLNELRSATLACAIIGNDIPMIPILATNPKYIGPSSVAAKTLNDLDYAYFGFPYEEFQHVTDLIRQEYGFLSDDQWKAGRLAFIETINPKELYFHKI
jgi:predicted metal-dependent HD superfamily phosphohydrolase